MFPFKRFIQGPNLHEESVAAIAASASRQQAISGEDAKKIYEEILSMPETSVKIKQEPGESFAAQKQSSTLFSSTKKKRGKQKKKFLTLNQLMGLSQGNNFSEIEEHLSTNTSFDLNEKDIYGWTLLMSAACAGANDCAKLLLKFGASHEIQDKKGLNALELAKKNGRKETFNILQEWERSGYSSLFQEDSEEEERSEPIFCEACSQTFTNQRQHIKSIVHLLSSGQMRNSEGIIHYGIPESNRGFQLLLSSGWDKQSGLGPEGKGNKFPVKTVLKRNREGVGSVRDKKAGRITHFPPFDTSAVQGPSKEDQARLERLTTTERRAEEERKNKEKRKEINYRRELND
jgi:hypothetical protein